MSDPMKQAWSDVGEGFATLGRMMKDRYEGDDEAAGAAADERDDEGAGAALREAVDRLVAAGKDLGDRASDVVRDDDVKEQAKRAASQLNDAIGATVDLIGAQVGGLFGRASAKVEQRTTDPAPPTDATASDVPRSAPPSDDARQ